MSETVHLGVYDTMADWETGYATAHINTPEWQRRPGRYRISTVAESAEPITTAGGMRVQPETSLAELAPSHSAMLILPGAAAWDAGELSGMARMARRFLEAGVPVAAICGATAGLAREGLLDERAHTSSARDYLAATGYRGGDLYRQAPAVTDGALITAGPQAPVDFAREIFRMLDLYDPGVLEGWFALFRHQDSGPFEVMAAGAVPSGD